MEWLAIIFYIYSFLGWSVEVARAATKHKHFVNKGFLNGVLCPRYGVTMVLVMVLLDSFRGSYIILFFGSMFIATVVEYVTSVLLEKITGSRWWDYSNVPLQFQGRICLPMSLVWGAAYGIFYLLNRLVLDLFQHSEIATWQMIVLVLLTVLLLLDYTAAVMTALSIQENFQFLLSFKAKLRKFTRRIGNWIFEDTHLRIMREEIRKESARMRNTYRKERQQRMMAWLKRRMILAEPDLAPDEHTLEMLETKQKSRKKKLFRRIMLNRVLFTAIALLAQVVWLAVVLNNFAKMSNHITLAMTVLSFLISIYVYTKNDNSAYRISWIIIIMAFPVFGGLLYVFFGNKNPSRKMRFQLEKVHCEKGSIVKQDKTAAEELKSENERVYGRSHYLRQKSDYPIWQNTTSKYYPLGEDMFEDMLEDLKKAKHFIFLEFFIIEEGIFWGSILEILKEKAKEGVDVRLIYDDIGCLMLLPKGYQKELEEAGISCMVFNPFKPILSLAMNNRDHRKILVIDGYVGYTGGVNLADEYINMADRFGHWKDTAMRFEGEAVANFTIMFLEMWNAFRKTDEDFSLFMPHVYHPEPFSGKGFIQPFGDTPLDNEPTAENLYIDILNNASRYVYIFTPYLIISDTMQHALCMAASRGVDVKIMTPGIPDKKLVFRLTRSNYKELLKAGVEVYEYTPGFLHAKSYVSDDETAVVGTINMDYRSLYLHFECGAYLYKTDSVLDVKEDFLNTMKKARKIELKFLRQGLIAEIFDSILAIISPLV